MKLVSLTCPGCGANLSIEDGRKQCFCQYCGMKIMLDDESITYRTVDEARIKEAEVRMHEIDLLEKRRAEWKKNLILGIKITIPITVILILFTVIGYMNGIDKLETVGSVSLSILALVWVYIWASYDTFINKMDKKINEGNKSFINISFNGKQLKMPSFNSKVKEQKKPRK